MPTRRIPSTPIQARPRVILTTRPESGSWRTASAVRTAAMASLGWAVVVRRFGVARCGLRRAGALVGAGTARERVGFRAGLAGLRAGALRFGGVVREGAVAGVQN